MTRRRSFQNLTGWVESGWVGSGRIDKRFRNLEVRVGPGQEVTPDPTLTHEV